MLMDRYPWHCIFSSDSLLMIEHQDQVTEQHPGTHNPGIVPDVFYRCLQLITDILSEYLKMVCNKQNSYLHQIEMTCGGYNLY
jgi:hypothetical protein